ncbi:MAG: ABC transporter ATP-binding protein [Pyrinomonadaceae bacterium]
MSIVIKAENLSKSYRISHRQSSTTLRDAIANSVKQLRQTKDETTFWALNDVSFEVRQGEVLGIIGRNGAGKSTLLKILSRITKPTKGRAELRGRVGSLLEVGTGFHAELTGRENVYLNGAILGMKHDEIKKKFDEIVAFAGYEDFLDTPVKHFSSGMYMRLAFSVAAHLEPEILIVDEVLAVGDMEFQKKCLGKMDEVGKSGRTVIFVSHQLGTIAQMCHETMLIDKGKLVLKDATQNVINAYVDLNRSPDNFYQASEKQKIRSAFFDYVKMVNDKGETIASLEHDKPMRLEFKLELKAPIDDLMLGFSLQDAGQKRIFTIHQPLKNIIPSKDSPSSVRLTIPGGLLTPGYYSWIVAAFVQGGEMYDAQWGVCGFNIIDAGSELAAYDGVDYGCVFVRDYSFETVR